MPRIHTAPTSQATVSDDENGRSDDDDGVQFATSIVGGRNSIMIVEASKPGFLNAWIDLDRNGKFDTNEQVSHNYYVNAGKQSLYTYIPRTVVEGDSWARFRLSSIPNISPTGGVADGEVEDYKIKLVEEATTVSYYPTNNSWTTLAFEDNWPHEGDYDMNDLVVYMRTAVHRKNAGVSRVEVKAEVAAVGAAYHNGFAIRLPGIKRSQVNLEEMELEINGKPVTDFQPLEEGRDEAILIVTYNVWDYVNSGELCLFYRTEPGCGSNIEMNFYASIPLQEPAQVEVDALLDPFLFATPGAWHGDHLVTAPGRSYERFTLRTSNLLKPSMKTSSLRMETTAQYLKRDCSTRLKMVCLGHWRSVLAGTTRLSITISHTLTRSSSSLRNQMDSRAATGTTRQLPMQNSYSRTRRSS